MNKKILGAGAASTVLAAMPLLGVFAEPITTQNISQTDTIRITVPASCELAVSGDGNTEYSATMSIGSYADNIAGSKFKISCNNDNSWGLKAVGATTEGSAVNALKGSGENSISSSEGFNADSLKNDADGSDWGFKLADGGDEGAQIVGGYNDFKQIPTTPTEVATSKESGKKSASVQVTYGVVIGSTQAPDTYEGKVTYTLSQPAD